MERWKAGVDMDQIVTRVESTGTVPPSRIPKGDPSTRREITIQVEAETLERQLKRAVIQGGTGSAFEIYCDEGTPLGGDDSAPPPLMYFSAGVAF